MPSLRKANTHPRGLCWPQPGEAQIRPPEEGCSKLWAMDTSPVAGRLMRMQGSGGQNETSQSLDVNKSELGNLP